MCGLNPERLAAPACAAHIVEARVPPAGGTHLRSYWRTSASVWSMARYVNARWGVPNLGPPYLGYGEA
jgi:hypothetical protein